MSIGLTIVGWFLVAIIGVGVLTIKSMELLLKWDENGTQKLNDIDRATIRAFLQIYWNNNFAGRVVLVTVYGAKIWAMILFNRKGD